MHEAELEPMRLSVRAVIVRDGRLLLVENVDTGGLHFNLPGGGVEPGEGLHEALQRELWEECRVTADVGRLLFAHEYDPVLCAGRFGWQRTLALNFLCTLHAGREPQLAEQGDAYQTGVRWLPLVDLPRTPLVPFVGELLCHALATPLPDPFVLLGDTHLVVPGYPRERTAQDANHEPG